MGLSPVEFAELTPFLFDLKCEGFKDAELALESRTQRLAWVIFGVNADPKAAKGVTPDDIYPIAGKKVAPRQTGFTKAKVASMIKKMSKLNNK